MGCDIHAFLEYRKTGNRGWSAFGGEFTLDRNYAVFSNLADVRSYGENKAPVAANRGVPDGLSWRPDRSRLLYITDTEGDGNTTKENAERWIAKGYSKKVGDSHITRPDLHSHSWCNANELEEVINRVDSDVMGNVWTHEYRAFLSAMRQFEAMGFESRMVFWFDN